MEDFVFKNYFDNELPKWNRFNGYDIEQVISNLAYDWVNAIRKSRGLYKHPALKQIKKHK